MGGRSGYASYISGEFAWVPVEAVSVWRRGWIWRGDEAMRYGLCCRVYISELRKRS